MFIDIHAHAPLGDLLRHYKDQGGKGLGEVMPNLRVMDPMVRNLFKHAQDVGLPVMPRRRPRAVTS